VDNAGPVLPDAAAASETIKAWAASQPRFAELLGTGVPVVRALTRWGFEFLAANQSSEAVAAFGSALALIPGDPVLWANYGMALKQADSTSEAAACLERSVALLRFQPETWLMLGLVRRKLGDLAGAEAAYRVALEQEPQSGVAWQLIAGIKEEQRDFAGAVECIELCRKAGGTNAALMGSLGKLHYQLGRIAESSAAYAVASGLEPANAHFRRMARKSVFVRDLLQGEPPGAAIARYRNSFPAAEAPSDQDLKELLSSASSILSGFGHIAAAAGVGRKMIELWPENPTFRYLQSALLADPTIDRSPPEYVVEHFDAFAAGFEAQLVGALGYDLPEKLGAAVRKIAGETRFQDTLDAGCGTGLCGPLIRPISRVLTGVDLSPKMLEQAAKKGTYDTLVCEELTAFLVRSPDQFDLIVAADLMIYFGDLAPLFAAAATALRCGGLFAFSIELWTGEGYRLQPSGRFAQAPDYVRAIAGRAFEEVFHTETTIRLEAMSRLRGSIFIFRRSEIGT